MRISLPVRAAVTMAAAALTVVPFAAPALAAGGSTYTVPLHQPTPITASGFGEHGNCPGISANQDGWHFVLPTNSTDFVKLTVTFQPGGQQVITTFGPPSDKHAYVASAPGATLTSATAEVKGGEVSWFNLSHTCPATGTTTPSPTPSPSQSTTKPPTPTPSVSETSGSKSPSSTSPSAGASVSTSPSAGSSVTASPSGSATVAGASGAAGSPSASTTVAAGAGSGSLASTGANVIAPALAGLLLVGGGTFLAMRRRKGAHQA
ncbi:LPXTG cell wall anchor domain-containing protein [Kitasatospora azatica]|uniref:LPXTG cell wall anchor domain-containing protein n=1 Tax=Kitasatospora azatica TaxID=58347 RepID=UPI001E65AFE1|nr:LPXTG cell wall anchor domain-containing protein [Kitasatospora azatica]